MSSTQKTFKPEELNPLTSLDVWEDDVLERYPDPPALPLPKQRKNIVITMNPQEIP